MRVPWTQIPELPAEAPAWFQEWTQRLDPLWFQNFQYLSLVPTIVEARSTASLLTSTTPAAVPSLAVSANVPAGGIVHVITFLEMSMTTAGTTAIGELEVTYPSGHTSVQPAHVECSGAIRGTFGQQWTFQNGPVGEWDFRMLGSQVGGAGTGTISSANSVMTVEVS